MALRIPKEEVGPLAEIKALAPTSLERFVSMLKEAPLIPDPREMTKYIATQIPTIPEQRLASMIGTLYTLYHIRELSGVGSEQFLDDLMEGIREIPNSPIAEKGVARFRMAVGKLLDIESLSVVAKAARLQRDGERLYCNAKILSDIRPVFGSDPTQRPLGAVLAHTLKIGYHSGKDHQEFHVVLDSNDLEKLAEVIQRAKAKDRSLRELLGDAHLKSLDE